MEKVVEDVLGAGNGLIENHKRKRISLVLRENKRDISRGSLVNLLKSQSKS